MVAVVAAIIAKCGDGDSGVNSGCGGRSFRY